jgi:diketogulonate reductase-like aldo/keto reductase
MATPTVTLNNGVLMPMLGLGVYQSRPGRETESAVRCALDLGYRHIDTAKFYRNESDVGKAVRQSGVPRDQVFVTTKLANTDHGYSAAMAACEESLRELGFDYVDLYLIHWPVARLRGDSWRAFEKLLETKKCRAIGVSNYTTRHLHELLSNSSVVPAVNQVELSPFLSQTELVEFCRDRAIRVEAYSPLTQGRRLGHPLITKLATKYGRTPAQIMLRWAVQHELVVIPKSTRPERIQENMRIFDFEIGDTDMASLDDVDENLHNCWDPTSQP